MATTTKTTTKKSGAASAPKSTMNKAMGLVDIANAYQVPSKLSDAGKQYVADLEAMLKATVEIENLSVEGVESRVFATKDHKYAILVLLKEGCVYNAEATPISLVEKIAKLYRSKFSMNLSQTVLIQPEDYHRVEKMAMYISNTLKAFSGEVQVEIGNFTKTKLKVTTNKARAMDFIKQLSPHETPARADIALVISAIDPSVVPTPVYGQQNTFVNNEIDLIAVTGYTEFVNGGTNAMGASVFQPVITITDIVTKIPNMELLSVVLPLIADAFATHEGWLQPYKRFGKDDPNLGALVVDTKTRQPSSIKTIEELYKFRTAMIGNPIIAIDITDGRARIPGIDFFKQNPTVISKQLSQFITGSPTSEIGNMMPVFSASDEVIGQYQDGSIRKDSRCIDYLELAKTIKDSGRINTFLFMAQTPYDKLKLQQQFYDVEPLFINKKVILDATFVAQIATRIHQVLSVEVDYMSNQGLPQHMLQGAQFNNFAFVTAQNRTATMPGSVFYGY